MRPTGPRVGDKWKTNERQNSVEMIVAVHRNNQNNQLKVYATSPPRKKPLDEWPHTDG